VRFALKEAAMRRPHPGLFSFGAFACAVSLAFAAAAAGSGQAAAFAIYPAKGQTAKQQDRDKYECHDWARGQSGFDPAQPNPAPSSSATAAAPDRTGAMVRGAMRGAAVAELSGHDAGKGAATGVVGATVAGRIREQQAAQARQQQAMQQQQAGRAQQKAAYDRAFAACMDARGYVVR
jgi:hypothetical protein